MILWILLASGRAGAALEPDGRPPPPPSVRVERLSGGAAVRLLSRTTLPLVRVELSLATDALVRSGRVGAGDLDALGAAWDRTTDAGAPAGVLASAGCDTARCWFGAVGPVESSVAMVAFLGALVAADLRPEGHATWRSGALDSWRSGWRSASFVHASAVGRLLWPSASPYRSDRPRPQAAPGWAAVRAARMFVLAEARASIAVVGAADPGVLPALERSFGHLRGTSGGPPPIADRLASDERVVVLAPGARDAYVEVIWRAPGGHDPEGPAWDLVFRALAQGFTARVNQRLREAEGLTYGVDAAWWETPADGLSRVGLSVEPGRAGEAVRKLAEELERMRVGGPTGAELRAARQAVWADEADAWGTLAGVAWRLWLEPHHGRVPGARLLEAPAYDAVTDVAASRVAARWLAQPRTWVVTGPPSAVEAVFANLGWQTDRTWTACDAVYGGACP